MEVPTDCGFCTMAFAAVIRPMLSSRVFPAPAKADAERTNASPIEVDEVAKLFKKS